MGTASYQLHFSVQKKLNYIAIMKLYRRILHFKTKSLYPNCTKLANISEEIKVSCKCITVHLALRIDILSINTKGSIFRSV